MTLLLVHRPKHLLLSLLYDMGLVTLGVLLLVVSARTVIPLPFTPVPVTGQTLAIFLIASSMGRTRGTLSVLSYILVGIAGLPVFAGGTLGIARIFGPTGGYIIGFLLGAYVIGYLSEKGWDRQFPKALLTFLIGNILIYIPGVIQLSIFTGWNKAFLMGLYPFIPGDIVKIMIAGTSFPLLWRLRRA